MLTGLVALWPEAVTAIPRSQGGDGNTDELRYLACGQFVLRHVSHPSACAAVAALTSAKPS
jgi:hypothetical protein